jgi:hypothetical protein
MSELERWDYEIEVPDKHTRKRLAHIEQQSIIRRAATEAARRETAAALEASRQQAVANLEASEHLTLLKSRCRLSGTYDLADYACHRATGLNRSITHQSQDNPGLEIMHRTFENTAATVAALIIYDYGTGR